MTNTKKYQLIKEQFIKEIDSNVQLLEHKKTKARILLMPNKDNNKVFAVGFRTPPVDDTGVPHILEHSTLCGSKKFPVKDPFVELLKSSLNTFLNAMTYPDKTVYPFASCNEKDFSNLMEVYMDAVFYPNVYTHEEIFKQEGWHYELEAKDKDLIYNGVVYNEMKGAYSSPEQVVMRECQHSLFPDTTYGVDSGGNPSDIPNLTYEAFKKFHSQYYHPSNSYIIIYGDVDMESKLAWLDSEYLSKFDEANIASAISYQKPFEQPHEEKIYYPVGKEESLENKTYYAYNSVIGTFKDIKLSYAYLILSYALLDAPGAPLKQALLDKGLGNDVISGYDNGLLQPTLSIILKDAKEGMLEEFKTTIKEALTELVNKGLDKKSLKSAINYYEFKYRESDFGVAKGLIYALNALGTWLYDDSDPFSNLEYDKYFTALKEDVETNYFEELIKKYLLENNHSSYIVVSPSNTMGEEEERKVKEKLAAYKQTLSDKELDEIIASTQALKEYQATPSTEEELATMPTLTRDDISDETEPLYNEEIYIDNTLVLKHNIETSGIAYLDFNFNTINVPSRLIPYLGLLTKVLGYVDTKNYKYEDLYKEVNINTGGIEGNVLALCVNENGVAPYFRFETKVLFEKIPFVFDIVKEIITTSVIDNRKRLAEIIAENKSQRQMTLLANGHVTAINRAFSYIRSSSAYSELTSGISQYKFIEELNENFNDKYDEIVNSLKELITYVFRKENLFISYTANNDDYKTYVADFANSLYNNEIAKAPFVFEENKLNEGFTSSSQVQYVAKVGNFGKEHYTGAFQVFGGALRYDYLWMQVRVLGGAYGCMWMANENGNMCFVSYRDPNLEKTLDVYNNVLTFMDSFNPTEKELTKFIISAIGSIDTPLSPKMKGERSFRCYIQKITMEDLKKERSQILNVTVKDIKELRPLFEKVLNDDAICVLGNENKIKGAKDLFKEVKMLFK